MQRYVKEGSQSLQEGMPQLTASSGMEQMVILSYHLLLIANTNLKSHMHGLFYTNSVKSCMKDGEINIFFSEVSRFVANDSAEQVVSGMNTPSVPKCVYIL